MNSVKLKYHQITYDTIELAEKAVKAIPKSDLLRLSTDVTALVGCIVEDGIPKKCNVDKKAITTQILNDIYTLTETEQEVIGEQIDYLLSIGKIKRTSSVKLVKQFSAKLINSFFSQN